MGLAIAESDDGVHWRETADFACSLEHGMAGYCLRWTGKEFVYFVTERNQGADRKKHQVVMRQHRPYDLNLWEFMGPASKELRTCSKVMRSCAACWSTIHTRSSLPNNR